MLVFLQSCKNENNQILYLLSKNNVEAASVYMNVS